MKTQAEAPTVLFDVVKQVFSVLFVVAAVAAFYYFSETIPLLYRVVGLLVVVLAVLGMMFTTSIGKNVWLFILEAKQEVRKVVWPTREETMRTTLLVFGMVTVVGLILWFLDMFLFWGVRLLTGQGG
jgi:preprotein translocase subunit SecE